jgi:hypothetical protein
MFTKEFFAQFLSLLGQDDRLCLAHRVENQSFFVQTSQRIPVVSFPCASGVMKREKEECQNHLINLVFVVVHDSILSACDRFFNRLPGLIVPNHAPQHRGAAAVPLRGARSLARRGLGRSGEA